MRQKILFILILLCTASGVLAQKEAEFVEYREISRDRLLLSTGMNLQIRENTISAVLLGIERPIGPFQNVGFQISALMRSDLDRTYSGAIRPGSFEVGVFLKNFLHGHLSNYRNGIYLGPDLRVSFRNYAFAPIDFSFPPNPNRTVIYTKGTTVRVLLNTGWQYRIGKGMVEISLPIGFEHNKSNSPQQLQGNSIFDPYKGNTITILPTITIGYVIQ